MNINKLVCVCLQVRLFVDPMEICDFVNPNNRCIYLFSCYVDFTAAARLSCLLYFLCLLNYLPPPFFWYFIAISHKRKAALKSHTSALHGHASLILMMKFESQDFVATSILSVSRGVVVLLLWSVQ